MLNHIELAKECGASVSRSSHVKPRNVIIFQGDDQLAAYTNAIIDECQNTVRGENAYCAVILEDLKVKG